MWCVYTCTYLGATNIYIYIYIYIYIIYTCITCCKYTHVGLLLCTHSQLVCCGGHCVSDLHLHSSLPNLQYIELFVGEEALCYIMSLLYSSSFKSTHTHTHTDRHAHTPSCTVDKDSSQIVMVNQRK